LKDEREVPEFRSGKTLKKMQGKITGWSSTGS
jgi:hypothetical protein